jgi:hypothetical protein
MSGKALYRIQEVHPLSEFRLGVRLEGKDHEFVVSLLSLIRKGGVFKSLETRGAFEAVKIDGRRRAIFWPKPVTAGGEPLIDIDAEALVEMAKSQLS